MDTSNKPQDRPKLILLTVALLVAGVFIASTLISANKEKEVAAEEMDDVSLMLPQPSDNSGAMLLWNVTRPPGRNPFKAGTPGAPGAAAMDASTVTLNVEVTEKPPARVVEPERPKLNTSIVLKGVMLNAGGPASRPLAIIKVGNSARSFRIGSRVMDGVILKGIGIDGIMLDVFGTNRFLGLNERIGPGTI